MEFKLIADSTPQVIMLKYLETVNNSNRDGEKRQKIDRAGRIHIWENVCYGSHLLILGKHKLK